jgi:ABC-type Fe3+/spermidine/putrescine transport system ATPase subunit
MTPALLQVKDLRAGYGRAEVLTGLNFHLDKGQVVTVIGPNGAGKSTTLNALMGVLPSRGTIVFDGQDLADASLEDRVMMGLALVPEKRVRHHAGGRQPRARRLPVDEAQGAELAWRARTGLRAVSSPEGKARTTRRHLVGR